MKKSLLLLLCIISALPMFAREFEYKYAGWTLTYTVLDEEAKTCEVSAVSGFYSGDLVIPETVKDGDIEYSVTSIGQAAFFELSSLTSVSIPNSVLSIGSLAFSFCTRLTSVKLPNSITEIGGSAFLGCYGLTSVTLPNSAKNIGGSAFEECSQLREVVFSPSIELIGNRAFSNCTALESIVMGPNLKRIEEMAFTACPIKNIFITAPIPPIVTIDLLTGGFSASPKGYRTTYIQNESIYDNYGYENNKQYVDWYNYIFLVQEWGRIRLMTEPTELRVEDSSPLTGRPGDAFRLSAKLYPEDVTLPYVFWRSTDPEIASVDSDGLVTIHADLRDAMPLDEGDELQPACKIIAETLYYGGPVVEIPVVYKQSSGIKDVVGSDSSSDIDPNAPVEVFTIQGTKVSDSVDKLSAGIYIVRQGNKVKKISVQ